MAWSTVNMTFLTTIAPPLLTTLLLLSVPPSTVSAAATAAAEQSVFPSSSVPSVVVGGGGPAGSSAAVLRERSSSDAVADGAADITANAGRRRSLQDVTPPSVDVRIPYDGETVSDHSYVVAARVLDDNGGSGVSNVQFQFKFPPYGIKTEYLDANAPTASDPDVYFLPLPLHLGPDGPWEWRVKTIDVEGNKEVTAWADFAVAAEPRLPDDLDLTVNVDGEEVELSLTRRSVRADGYELKLWSANKGYEVTTSKEVRTYRGTAAGRPNTIVVGSIFPDGTASINGFEGRAYKWRLEHVDVRPQLPPPAVFEPMLDSYASDSDGYGDDLPEEDTMETRRHRRSLLEGRMGTATRRTNSNMMARRSGLLRRLSSSTGSVQPPSEYFPPSGGMKEVELAFDIAHYYLNDEWAGSWDRAVAELEYLANVYDHFMARDTMIASVVTQSVIRTEQFYFPTGTCGSQLSPIADEWVDGALADTPWDLVNSVFATEAQRAGAAGCARGNSVGKNGPGVSVKALYHETGHNWGAQHKTYARDTMDGNRPHHGPCNVERVLRRRDITVADGTLSDYHGGAYPDPLHPYAHVDIGATLVDQPLVVPVLANDWDSNGDDISVGTFSPLTANGGTVTKVQVNSQDALRYVPPSGYVGKDVIYYELQDSTGLTTQELVHIEVIDGGLALHYDFEIENLPNPGEVSNALAGRDHPGRYAGESVGGVVGRAVRLNDALIADHRNLLPPGVHATDRADDYPLDDFQLIGNSFDPMDRSYALAFWFRVDTTNLVQVARKDYQRDGQFYGYHVDVSNKRLTFTTKEFSGLLDPIEYTSDPIVERDVWYHVAVVYDRDDVNRVMLYLDGGKLFQSDLTPGSFVFMGRGPLRFGEGAGGDLSLDDVRVYTRALSLTEVTSLVGEGGKPTRFGEFLEAEDTVSYGGGIFKTECGGDFSGTGYFDYEADDESAYLEWSVDVPEAGPYDLTFVYGQKSENRKLRILVNGVVADDAKGFPVTGAWCKFDTTDLTLTLNAGVNTVRAEAKGNSGPVIDYIILQHVPETYIGPPRFSSDTIAGLTACAGKNVSTSDQSVAPFAFDWDPNDLPLTFEKRSGPGWISVESDGTLTGTPKNRHVGINAFRARVTDPAGLYDNADFEINVKPPIDEDLFDFTSYNIRGYDAAANDVSGTVAVEDCGATLSLTGNLYKSVVLDPPHVITPDTVLEFDFRSGSEEGNVHAIGLDEDDDGTKSYFFKLYGTREKSAFVTDFETYAPSAPQSKHYVIPIGQYYAVGTAKTRLFFVNDHDSASNNPTAESVYSNVKLYETSAPLTPPPTASPVTSSPTSSPTSPPTGEPTTSSPTSSPTRKPTTSSPTPSPTSQPTPSPADACPPRGPTQSSADGAIDLTGFVPYTSEEQFFASDSSAYFLTSDPAVGPTARVWWGDSYTTVQIPFESSCLPPGETVLAQLKAQQTDNCGKTWQMNAGRVRNEYGHSLVLTLDDSAAEGANPWLEYYYLQGCDFTSAAGPYTFTAYAWHDNDPDVETQIGSALSLDFAFTIETDLPSLADLGDCTKSNPCGECQGDCDNDNHCAYGLICHQRDGTSEVPGCAGAGTDNTDHCVVPPTPLTLVKVGDEGVPASAFPLGKCRGDCDDDADCDAGLVCFQRDGTEAVPGCEGTGGNKADYCYDPNDA